MSRIGIHVSDVFGRVACDNQVLADSTGSRATMNCVLISAENKVVGRAAEILARKTKKNLLRGSDYMSLRNNKECVELFLREMIRTASTAGDKIEAIVLGIPAFRYLGDVEYVKELVSILKTHCDHVRSFSVLLCSSACVRVRSAKTPSFSLTLKKNIHFFCEKYPNTNEHQRTSISQTLQHPNTGTSMSL